ncbi:hypothetical protein OROGR_010134 [Orobanche gracilis]
MSVAAYGGSGGDGDDGRDWKNALKLPADKMMMETMQKNNKGNKTTDGTNKTMGKKKTASDHLVEKPLDESY